MADHVAVMSGGKILQLASPRELYERPNCREVADFIGEINFFHATVREIGAQIASVNAGVLGVLTLPAANLAPGIKAGDHILLAIRPEHVAFAPSGVAGEIAASTFLGERSHFHICLPGRSEPVAVSGHAPPPGAVYLAFPPEKLIGLPA